NRGSRYRTAIEISCAIRSTGHGEAGGRTKGGIRGVLDVQFQVALDASKSVLAALATSLSDLAEYLSGPLSAWCSDEDLRKSDHHFERLSLAFAQLGGHSDSDIQKALDLLTSVHRLGRHEN